MKYFSVSLSAPTVPSRDPIYLVYSPGKQALVIAPSFVEAIAKAEAAHSGFTVTNISLMGDVLT